MSFTLYRCNRCGTLSLQKDDKRQMNCNLTRAIPLYESDPTGRFGHDHRICRGELLKLTPVQVAGIETTLDIVK